MEKRINISHRKPRVVITGPESTGKTTLSNELAAKTGGLIVPEYARCFIEKLDRPYTYEDVEYIAREQIKLRNEYFAHVSDWVFFDTDLIITRVWFEEVYKKVPDWFEKEIQKNVIDLYLLCSTDPPWTKDPVRENGGERRLYLFHRYEQELKKYDFPFYVVTGLGKQRFRNALKGLDLFFEKFNLL